MQPKVLDLNGAVTAIEKMLQRLIGEDIELRTVTGASLGFVRADPGQLEQVVMNLVVNARDAMPRGGQAHARDGERRRFADGSAGPLAPMPPGHCVAADGQRHGLRHGRGDAGHGSSSRSSRPRSPARAPGSVSRRCTASSSSAAGSSLSRARPEGNDVQDLPAAGGRPERAGSAASRTGARTGGRRDDPAGGGRGARAGAGSALPRGDGIPGAGGGPGRRGAARGGAA